MTQTIVLVRVQAKGGKFVGPDAGFSRVTLRDSGSGGMLAQGLAAGGSGQLLGTFTPAATRQCIVTPVPGAESLLWLSATPEQATAGFTAALDLDAPTRVEFTAEALTDGTPNGHTSTQTMWITPGANLVDEPGVVLLLPGLIVRNLTATQAVGASVNVSAYVAMMCGCKIDPSLPWHPAEFAVTAVVTGAGGVVAQAPLALQGMSVFTGGPVALPGPGTYTLTVDAVQAAEGNVGSASVRFTIPG